MAITDEAEAGTTQTANVGASGTGVRVQNRDGSNQTVEVNKIVRAL